MNDLDELCLLSYLCMTYTCDGIDIHERKKVWEDKKESTSEKEKMRKRNFGKNQQEKHQNIKKIEYY